MPRWRLFSGVCVVLVAGCTAMGIGWDEVDYCGPDGCTACTNDHDCVTGLSCCAEALYCSHRDDAPNVCQLGCVEPDPPPCTCQRGRCRFE